MILWFLVVEHLSLQTRRAACDLLLLKQAGLPVQTLHVDTYAVATTALRNAWNETTQGRALPLTVLPRYEGDSVAETVASYVRGALDVDPTLRANLVTVWRRARPLSWRSGVLSAHSLPRQLRNEFRSDARVVLTDYCEGPEA